VNERFKSFFGTYFRGCNGLIFVFDSGNSASFLYIKKLLNNVKEIGFIDKAKLLISFETNEIRREVSPEAIAAFALENDMMF
jgi:signal recognition particle receptor subunit beta